MASLTAYPMRSKEIVENLGVQFIREPRRLYNHTLYPDESKNDVLAETSYISSPLTQVKFSELEKSIKESEQYSGNPPSY